MRPLAGCVCATTLFAAQALAQGQLPPPKPFMQRLFNEMGLKPAEYDMHCIVTLAGKPNVRKELQFSFGPSGLFVTDMTAGYYFEDFGADGLLDVMWRPDGSTLMNRISDDPNEWRVAGLLYRSYAEVVLPTCMRQLGPPR